MRIYKTLMNKTFIYLLIAVLAACKSTPYSDETTKSDLRAPAYPLLTLYPHVKLWSMTDELNKQNMTFGGSTQLPFVGFLRVDGAMYRFMGSKELPMQAIAPMALDHEKWEGKFTSLVPDEGWEQPDFDDKYWQLSEGAFGTPGMWEARTQWTSSNIWVRREVEVDPYLLEHKKIYLRYSHDDVFQLYINGKQLVNTGYVTEDGQSWFADVPEYSPGFTVGVLGELYLNQFLSLRLVPTLHFGDKKVVFREQASGEEHSQSMKSAYLSVPVDLKFSAERFNNYRPYLVAGIAPTYDFSVKKQGALLVKPFDCYVEVGLGCDFYLPYFKLIPELKFCFGLANLIKKDRKDLTDQSLLKFTQSVDKITSRMIVLTFYFE